MSTDRWEFEYKSDDRIVKHTGDRGLVRLLTFLCVLQGVLIIGLSIAILVVGA